VCSSFVVNYLCRDTARYSRRVLMDLEYPWTSACQFCFISPWQDNHSVEDHVTIFVLPPLFPPRTNLCTWRAGCTSPRLGYKTVHWGPRQKYHELIPSTFPLGYCFSPTRALPHLPLQASNHSVHKNVGGDNNVISFPSYKRFKLFHKNK